MTTQPTLQCNNIKYYCSIEQRELLTSINLHLYDHKHILISSSDSSSLSALSLTLAGLGKDHLVGEISGGINWFGQPQPEIGEVVLLQGGPSEQISGCCFTVRDELIFGAENIGLPRKQILEGMTNIAKEFELEMLLDREPFSLSGGEQQRLLLASAVLMRPKVLILQEAFSQLASQTIKKMAYWLQSRQGLTVIYCSNEPELYTPYVQKRYELDQGVISQVPLGEKRVSEPLLSKQSVTKSPVLEVNNLTFHHPGQKRLLENLSFQLYPKDIVALKGANGCGKTTLLNLLQGHLQPLSGDILLNGESLLPIKPWERSQWIGFVFQQPEQQLFSARLQDELLYGPRNIGIDPESCKIREKEAISLFELDKLSDSNPLDGTYSQRKAINMASVVTMSPKLLLLDEPSAGIGNKERTLLADRILGLSDQGCTFLIVSHDQPFINACCSGIISL